MSGETSKKYGPLVTALMEAQAYHEELRGESDRAAVILGAANFEDWLRETIMLSFVRLSKVLRNRIFENYGPLSTFSAKIDLAFALGIFDEKTRKNLHVIRKIRNAFAHSSKAITFDDATLASMCRGLNISNDSHGSDLRVRYLAYLIQVREKITEGESPFSRILVQR